VKEFNSLQVFNAHLNFEDHKSDIYHVTYTKYLVHVHVHFATLAQRKYFNSTARRGMGFSHGCDVLGDTVKVRQLYYD
jgi:hypothetical protein